MVDKRLVGQRPIAGRLAQNSQVTALQVMTIASIAYDNVEADKVLEKWNWPAIVSIAGRSGLRCIDPVSLHK